MILCRACSPMESNPKMRKEKFEKKDAIAKEKVNMLHSSLNTTNEFPQSLV